MAQAQTGDTVQVHYTGKLEDGTVFDSSRGGAPLGFTLGAGQVISGFEEAVLGLEPGQTRSTTIPPDEAYGERRDDLVVEVPYDQVPPELNPQVGLELQLTLEDGRQIPVVVQRVTGASVTLDANHPLADQTLIFDVELVAVG